ncbi:putative magnesium transporter NIPA4 [Glycine soja]
MIMLLSIFATTQEHNLTTNQEHNLSTAAFLFYAALVITAIFILIFHFIPLYGQTHIMVYIGVCSLVGSITVMSVKALGIVIKLTLSGMNQLIYPQTWAFTLVVIVCVLTQMNYLNKALDTFNTAVVSPIYYVMFTTFTIVASVIMFKVSFVT